MMRMPVFKRKTTKRKRDRKTSNKRFSALQDERIIEFVRSNECLYNVRHFQHRDRSVKDVLWQRLAEDLNKDEVSVKRRWVTMRDYFIRCQTNRTSEAIIRTKRDERLIFLLDTTIFRKKLCSTATPMQKQLNTRQLTADQSMYSDPTTADPSMQMHSDTEPSAAEQFMQFLMNRPRPEKVKPAVKDHMRVFCDSVYSTMCTLPAHEVARVKLEISNLVGIAELNNTQKSKEMTE